MNVSKSWSTLAALAAAICSATAVWAASPVPVDGLKLWLDATDFANTANGTKVQTWTDKASNIAFSQATASYRPTVATGVLNGRTVLKFTRPAYNQAQFLQTTWSQVVYDLFNSTNTAFAVARATAGGGDDSTQKACYIFSRPGNHSGMTFEGYPDATTATATRWVGQGATQKEAMVISTPYTQGEWITLSRVIRGNETMAPVEIDVSVNGELAASGSNTYWSLYTHGTTNGKIMRIGCANNNANYSGGLNGEIAEILVYDRELTADEQRTVYYYLADKWGLVPFEISNAANGNTRFTASATVSIDAAPTLGAGQEYQISTVSDPAELDSMAWVPATTPVPASYTFPEGTPEGDVTVYFWIRQPGDDGWVASVSDTINYTSTALELDVYVATDGNDETGTGLIDAPFKTITKAVAVAAAGMIDDLRVVHVGPGTYSTATGEIFPITISDNVGLVGAGMGETILDGAYESQLLSLETATRSSRIAELSLRGAKTRAINSAAWGGIFENIEISDVSGGNDVISYNNNGSARNLVVSGLNFTNIAITAQKFMTFKGTGSITFTNCIFASLSTTVGCSQANGNFQIQAHNGVAQNGWPCTFSDCRFEDITFAGAGHQEGGAIVMGQVASSTPHKIERCVFRNITYTKNAEALICFNRGQTSTVEGSLFDNVTMPSSSGYATCVGGFRTTVNVRNCTFHNCACALRPNEGNNNYMYAYNCIVSECGALSSYHTDYLYLKDVDIYETPLGTGYSEGNSSGIVNLPPYFKNPTNGDFSLKGMSPLIDLGNNANVTGPCDLAGGTRIIDGNGDGVAVVDLGCSEFDPSALGARFVTGSPTYGILAGGTIEIPVWIEPVQARGSVTAEIACPDALSGPASLLFPTGLETNLLVVTAANGFVEPDGTILALTITDSAGFLDGTDVGIEVSSRKIVVPGFESRVFLRVGEEATFTPQLPSKFFAAESAIMITATSLAGEELNTVEWTGTGIAAGESMADGDVVMTCGAVGSTSLTLHAPDGFVFDASGEDTIVFELVGFESPLYVSPEGSDQTGIGTEKSPLRTMTYSMPKLVAGETLRLLPGLYGPTEVEVFPVSVPEGISLEGVRGETESAADTAIVDPAGTGWAFYLGNPGADPGIVAGGALRSLVIQNAAGTALRARYWGGEIADCAIRSVGTGTYAGSDESGGGSAVLYVQTSRGGVTLSGTEIGCITTSVARLVHVNGGSGSLVVTNCWFHDLKSAAINGCGMVDGRIPMVVADTLVERLDAIGQNAEMQGVFYTYNVQADYLRDIFRDITFTDSKSVTQFSLLGINRCYTARIENCLFHDISSPDNLAVIGGFRADTFVRNCTFDNIPSVFHHTNETRKRLLYNSTVSHCAKTTITPLSSTYSVILQNVNLYDVDDPSYTDDQSVNVYSFDPMFKDAANGDYHFRSNSPLIDKGDNALVVAAMGDYDLDFGARILDGNWDGNAVVDLGCYELDPPPFGTLFMLK